MGKNKNQRDTLKDAKKSQDIEDTRRISKGQYKPWPQTPK